MESKDIGLFLKGVREEKGISYEELEKNIKIRKKYIIAIEAGNINIIPGKTYVYGYLRNYCQYLKIGDRKIESIINSFKENDKQNKNATDNEEKIELVSLRKKKTRTVARKMNSIYFRYIYLAGFVLVLFAGLLFMNNYLRDTKNYPLPSPEVSTVAEDTTGEANESGTGEVPEQTEIEPVIVEEIIVEEIPVIKIFASENTWFKVLSDDSLIFEGILLKDEKIQFKTKNNIKLSTLFPKNLMAYVDDEEIDLNQTTLNNQMYEIMLNENTENS